MSSDSWLVAATFAATGVLLAVAPISALAFLLQFFGVGTVLGTLIAYRARRRNPDRDTFPLQVRWGCVGLFGAPCLRCRRGGTLVIVLRVILAGLILASAAPLAGFADRTSPLGQFAIVLGLMLAVSFVLPHYFYRGEPLLPDRRRRD